MASIVNAASAISWPFCPIRAAAAGSFSSSVIAAARAEGLSGSTIQPVTPGTTASETEPTSVAITGNPASMASTMVTGNPSRRDGSTRPSKAHIMSATRASPQGALRNSTQSFRPSSLHSFRSVLVWSPSPMSTRLHLGSTMARACNSRSRPLMGS